jgi:hypothetical protein
MRRSRPYLKFSRIYTAKFTNAHWREFSQAEIHEKRIAVLEAAKRQFKGADATIEYELADDDNVTLKISASNDFDTPECITAQILNEAIRRVDEAFNSFSNLITESIDDFIKKDYRGERILGPYSYSGREHSERRFFAMAKFQIATSTIDFSVGSQVAAASRNQRQLKSHAERSVQTYYQSESGERPKPEQYTIEQNRGSSLQISADIEGIAEGVSGALLGEPRIPRLTRRSIDRWPPYSTPYWGVGTLALAIFAVAIAAFPVTPIWLAVTALGVALAVGSALIMARLAGASVPKTALGMTPSIVVMGFAVYYGSLMRGIDPSLTIPTTKAPHLVDAFLLSIGMASTGGFFDLNLRATAVRVVAFAEMLLIVSIAGGSLYVAAGAIWDRLRDNIVSTSNPG